MGDNYCLQNKNNNIYNVNKDFNIDIEIKIEENDEFETDLINLNPETDHNLSRKDLYQHHIVKEELVIGPEKIQEKTKDLNKTVAEPKTYSCKKCNDTFKSERSLFIHSKDVHSLKLCQFCHKVFNKTSNLKRHQNYSCPNNDSVPDNNKELKYGMFKHPFICDFCKKSYTHKNTLRDHIKAHMGLPLAYQCKICDKSYTKRHNLTCHMRSTHLKVKSYTCKRCGKKFFWRNGLTQHEKTFHKISRKKSK